MSEVEDQEIHRSKTSHTPSGGNTTANENGGMGGDSRGRYRDRQQKDSSVNRMNETQLQGQLDICSTPVAINANSVCAAPALTCKEPEAGDAARVDDHGDGGGRCEADTESRDRGDSGNHKRLNSACPVGGLPDTRLGRKRHRRRPSKKKRRWKPYYKLSWEEKKELDERETARASRVRAEMFAKGLPVAPYNTTQFLMEEHDREEPDLNTELGGRRSLGACGLEDSASEDDYVDLEDEEERSGGGSDGMGRPGNAGGEFLQRDFSETYEKYHVESLQNMTKQELVQEYLELEKCLSRLEEENNCLRRMKGSPDISAGSLASHPDASHIRQLEIELEKLRAQNSELRQQNQRYQERGPASPVFGNNSEQKQAMECT